MDILFPPDLVPTTMMFGVDDFTAVDESATTGVMQSSALYGTRRWHLRMDFAVLSRKTGSLARFEALTAALRGRANRVWVSPAPAAKLRGSFPAAEMFVNNDFSQGIASWGTDAQYSLSALDHGIRATRISVTAASTAIFQGVTRLAGIPYAIRMFIASGRWTAGQTVALADFNLGLLVSQSASQGMLEGAFTNVPVSTAIGIDDGNSSNTQSGNYFDAKWSSFSQCAFVDNGINLSTFSDDPSNAAWVKTNLSVGSVSGLDPIGNATPFSLLETSAASVEHAVNCANITVLNTAQEYSMGCFVKGLNRSWCFLQLIENTGGTAVTQYFQLTGSGTIGTGGVGANWSNNKATVKSVGNGWYYCTVTGRKTNAATSITGLIGSATADATAVYAGSTSNPAMQIWRNTIAQSQVPVQPIQSGSVPQVSTPQIGFALNLKGLPVSTQGLLLEGDMVECLMPSNSQLLRTVSRLDSDASGLGTLIFENALRQSPADNAGVVVQQPMGRFVLAASTLGIEYTPGVFGQASLEFVEAA